MAYPFQEIEKKWQQYWAAHQTFKAHNKSDQPKYYVLDMFPYPSGAGLHVGHPLGYIASDIISRFKRHSGYNVLHPQGYDSFGLPAEQYAIQTGQHPAITTQTNIDRYRQQLDRIGFSFDWSREVRTSNPEYYKWTQWIFLKLFNSWYDKAKNKARPIKDLIHELKSNGTSNVKAVTADDTSDICASDWNNMSEKEQQQLLLDYRLVYLAESEVNWCPELGTVLANDEVINGVSERGGYSVIRKKMKQWSMRISAYANRLLLGLEDLQWPEPLKEMQRNWIGRSVGASVVFDIENHHGKIEVFTTRPDTIFGVTFLTLAPEHPLTLEITSDGQRKEVEVYIEMTSKRSERERMTEVKKISGAFTGAYAIHPITCEKIPIWIGDYVLAGYGTGAVMAVPCGDQRDYEFANYFKIPIKNIFYNTDISQHAHSSKDNTIIDHSGFLNGLDVLQATQSAISKLEELQKGYGTTTYKLRDAVFSRQRYWGEPIPIYYDGYVPKPIPEHCLPLILPKVEKYLPTQDGAPPIGNAEVWAWDEQKEKVVEITKIDNRTIFPLELNTMPGWAGSSWYFNRYMDPHNDAEFVSTEALDYWKDVDLYLGGSEHATGHLLYARFWQQFLYDIERVPTKEFAKKLINQGMILGNSAFVFRKKGTNTYLSKGLVGEKSVEPIHVDISLVNSSNELDIDALKQWQTQFENASFELENGVYIVGREVEKMSKSKYNVINPDAICDQYGADTLRMYEMFLGPIEQAKPWNTAGITGVSAFLNKFWKLFHSSENTVIISDEKPSKESLKTLHTAIKKVNEDIQQMSLNTSVSAFMICVNELTTQRCNHREILEPLTVLLSPFAPHICEELWQLLGYNVSIEYIEYPKVNESYLIEQTKKYPISFNGKMRFILELDLSLSRDQIQEKVLLEKKTIELLDGKSAKKVIVVPNKIVNIVF